MDRRHPRFDWFLPALRRLPNSQTEPAGRWRRWARRFLPSGLFSNRQTKARGVLRRTLRALGPSWLYSPLRRLIQLACLLTFLWQFHYVCWPYTAQPQPQGQVAPSWRVTQVDQAAGRITLQSAAVPAWLRPTDREIYLVPHDGADVSASRATELAPRPFARFRVAQTTTASLLLEPTEPLPLEVWDRLLLNAQGWDIYERDPAAWPSHYADDLADKEWLSAELFLTIDPLVSLSTAIASRHVVWSLSCAAIILAICVLVPRGFCGYLCPLGTLIDLFDWVIGRHIRRFRCRADGWWVHLKYYLLLTCLICALSGILVTGYVAAIPVVTRGLLFGVDPLQIGVGRGWHLVPPITLGQACSLTLFFAVFALGLLQPRFWCKYVCPSGAMFSLGNLFRVTERKVETSCIHCNKCIEVCPFDAIKPDFTTRGTDCTFCQTCGGVCPTHAIKFVSRGDVYELKIANDPPTGETPIGRRGFISAIVGSAAATSAAATLVAATRAYGAGLATATPMNLPVRPPGSVPEPSFLQLCIRCGECFKACPNHVLQPLSWQQGLEGLWTPQVVADWAGCESSCNACGQVCPTGAIRALPLEEKRFARMGLALVNPSTCLPLANREACQLCVDECHAAGYHAIEFTQVHTQVDEQGHPLPETGYLAPVVLADRCVGCGLCQTRCYGINVAQRGALKSSAIVIEAGEGREDRLFSGSYRELAESRHKATVASPATPPTKSAEYFVPRDEADSGAPPAPAPAVKDEDEDEADPFGLQ